MSRELDIITKAKLTLTKYQTLRDLSSLIISNEYNEKSLNFSRLLIWKLLVIFNQKKHQELPILQLIETHLPELLSERHRFNNELSNCDIPWYQLSKDSAYYKESDELDIGTTRQEVLIDPLTGTSDSDRLFYLELIILDVERLFPQDTSIFVDSLAHRKLVIELLYLYYLKNGVYKQGMHELMGLIFKSLNDESLPQDALDNYHELLEHKLFQFYESSSLQLDMYIIFDKVIPRILDTYFNETALLQESIKFNLKLHELDQMLYHILLNKLKIQTPIWILRYFRLVLLRELGIDKSLILWDKLILFGNNDLTKLVPYFIILMLLQIRNFVLENEHDDILYLLLHYPHEDKITRLDGLVQDCIVLYNSELNLKNLSKVMIYKYCRKDDEDLTGNLKRVMSGKKKKKDTEKTNSIDESIGGNHITTTKTKKDFERTRLELRLAKRVNDLLKK